MSDATLPETSAVEFVDITPTPRILKLLGDIEFEPWQCIAELIDNGFDEFLRIKHSSETWNEPFEVAISPPSQNASADSAAVVVRDNGRGMTLDQVTDAVRAGWTTNDPLGNLGLFGMGFNIATARLGRVTRILTTRAGDAESVGVEIDLDRIGHDFAAPVIRRTKWSRGEHGTRVEVSSLYQRADWLRRTGNQRKLRETLGGIYSFLLDSEGFRLVVKDVAVKPIRHCTWDGSRTVTRGKDVIPAVIPIDKALADRSVCLSCATWQDVDNEMCGACGSDRLEIRERRVWGWLGIQRYLDANEFGIDFLRNGRKILPSDKSLFQWTDPDDPSVQIVEYPIELAHQGGRIVGEVHLDHVPVNYTKDAFEKSDKSWRDAVRVIRGDGPLLPETSKRLGLPPNDSPLAKLHRGYRRNDPGRNYLVPGNGKTAIHETAREWGRKFREGDAEYQSDTKWWEAVLRHEELKKQAASEKEDRDRDRAGREDDPTVEFRQEPQVADQSATTTETDGSEPQTERDRIEALLRIATPIPELDGQFTSAGVAGRPVKVTGYEVRAKTPQVRTPEGKRTPVLLARQKGGFAAFVDMTHSHFEDFDDDPADLVMMELAAHLIARADGDAPPISAVFADLKQRYLSSRTIDESKLAPMATQLMKDLKERMVIRIAENPERPWRNALNDAERTITGDRLATMAGVSNIDAAVMDGSYVRYVPETVVPRIVEEWPDAFLDGRLFRQPYQDVESPSARRQIVATITGYLNDIAWLTQAPDDPSRERLTRARLSLQLLPDEVVETEE